MSVIHSTRLALRGHLPPVAKSAYLKLRELNAGSRALPDFLIIGSMKAGTTSLFNYLCQHPQVIGSVPKEIFYFCSHPERGERWYRRHFPLRSQLQAQRAICGEATPTYLACENAPLHAVGFMPDVKIIALCREPAERAVSHYYHRVRAGREMRSIDEVFSSTMIERLARCQPEGETEKVIYDRGYYASGIKHWLQCYPREQILVLEAESLFHQPQSTFAEVCAFLHIDHIELRDTQNFNANSGSKQKPKCFHELRQAFKKQNQDLAALGYAFSWMESLG